MKELSIEEKAKAYDKAKYIMKEYLESGNAGVIAENTIKKAFPELAETDDERIKKIIKNTLQSYNRGVVVDSLNAVDYADCIAWLEKQQKPVDKIQLGKKYKCIASPRYSTFIIGKIYKPEDKFLCSLMNFCSDCFEPIEDGEQKSADKVEPKFKVGDEIKTKNEESLIITRIDRWGYWSEDLFICNFDDADNWELVEQNSDWSEEDEENKSTLISLRLACAPESWAKYAKWLKSLKDRVLPQPKQEWSEEDKCMLNNVIDTLKPLSQTTHSGYAINSMINWLKSLRPQSHWKPTEEQIKKELDKAANEWEYKASFSPIAMVMDGDRPTDVKQDITSHGDSFKAGVDWIIKKLK